MVLGNTKPVDETMRSYDDVIEGHETS